MQVKYGNSVLQSTFLLKFARNVFSSSIISSLVIAESSIILAKYFQFSQPDVAGF